MDYTVSDKKRLALLNVLKRLPAQLVYYASALGAVAVVGGANVPPELAILVGGVGVNSLSSMIERIANGDDVNDEALVRQVDEAVQRSDVASLLTTRDSLKGYSRLIKSSNLLRTAIENGDIEIVRILTEELARDHEILVELSGDISAIVIEQENAVQRDETIITLLHEIRKSFEQRSPINRTLQPRQAQIEIVDLHELIIQHFDRNDLELLVFDIEQKMKQDGHIKKLTLEMIGDGALPNVALKIIKFMEQRGALSYLIQAVKRARPLIDLP